jgi:hypothetical protein
VVTFFSGATMKRTGDTREVAAVGQLEIGQKGNLFPKIFRRMKKAGNEARRSMGVMKQLPLLAG